MIGIIVVIGWLIITLYLIVVNTQPSNVTLKGNISGDPMPIIKVGQTIQVVALQNEDNEGTQWFDMEVSKANQVYVMDFGGQSYAIGHIFLTNGPSYLKRVDNNLNNLTYVYDFYWNPKILQPLSNTGTTNGSRMIGKTTVTTTTTTTPLR